VRDVSLPDYTEVDEGETVMKTWELRNSGTCAWDGDYHLVLRETSDGMTSLDDNVSLPPTAPGETAQVSVRLRLGTGLNGGDLERANFELRNPDNVKFGVTPYGLVTVAGSSGGETGTLSGIVWLDYCSPPDGGSADPDGECTFDAINGYEGDGIRQADEDGLAGVTISLHSESCSGTKLEETLTVADGSYSFSSIGAGRYCVLLDPLSPGNAAILIPGGATYPRRESIPSYIVELSAGASRTDLDFGWDFQFD
jgi:hypothetical protein